MKIQVVRRTRWSRYYIIVKASNGETVLTSQRYATKSNATRAARRFQEIIEGSMVATLEVDGVEIK